MTQDASSFTLRSAAGMGTEPFRLASYMAEDLHAASLAVLADRFSVVADAAGVLG